MKRKAVESPSKPAKIVKHEQVGFDWSDNSNGSEIFAPLDGSPKFTKLSETSLKKPAAPDSFIVGKPEVRSLLKKPVNPIGKPPDVSLLRTSLLKPELIANRLAKTPDLPSSITLSPAVPNSSPVTGLFKKTTLADISPKPDVKIDRNEWNDAWAETLLSKSKRPRSETLLPASTGSTSLTKSVTVQRITPTSSVPKAATKYPTASIVSVNGSKTAIPLPSPLRMNQNVVESNRSRGNDNDYSDIAEDSDNDEDDGHAASLLFEPQVILSQGEGEEDVEMAPAPGGGCFAVEEEQFDEEFCDVCSMELINHADEQACDPDDNYVKAFKTCPVCSAKEPTREHVSRHFLEELLEVVDCFPSSMACTQCDYQGETTLTVALHIALVHAQIDLILQDTTLVSPFLKPKKRESERLQPLVFQV